MTLIKAFLVRFGGAPDGEPDEFYKDVVLSLLAALALLVATISVANSGFTVRALLALVVLLVAVAFATHKLNVACGAAGIACMRFVVGFLFAPSIGALVMAAVFGMLTYLLYVKAGGLGHPQG